MMKRGNLSLMKFPVGRLIGTDLGNHLVRALHDELRILDVGAPECASRAWAVKLAPRRRRVIGFHFGPALDDIFLHLWVVLVTC